MTKWFYDHLARLIYAKAVSWSAPSVRDLRGYVDSSRKAYYVEGDFGQYIMPNDEIYGRERRLYVDVERREDGHRAWSVPRGYRPPRWSDDTPVMRLANAMLALGLFTREGVRVVAAIWGKADFEDERTGQQSDALIWEMLEEFDSRKLFTEAAEDAHVVTLRGSWQLPMYHLDFSMIGVPLDELKREQDNIFYSQVGDGPW